MLSVGRYAKAVVAALAAGAAALVVATQDSSVSVGDVVTVVLSILGSLGVTYAVPNKSE